MSSRDASKNGIPSKLVAFPSLASSLNSLPQATSMQNVALHPARTTQDSHMLLQQAIQKNASLYGSQPPTRGYVPVIPPQQQHDSSQQLTMRRPQKK